MKTALRLILINFLIAQIVAPLLIAIPCALYFWGTTGEVDLPLLQRTLLIPAQLTGQVMMAFYLWKAGYISKAPRNWSPVSVSYLLGCTTALLSGVVVVSFLMSTMKWIPDIMEQSFDILQSGWGGILAIVLVGPVLEELLFRGAITRALLQQHTPAQAIFISSLLFGVFHINPAQMLPAFLIGLLLAWTYCQTGSIVPCTLMHLLNNSLAICLSLRYPDAEEITDLLHGPSRAIALAAALLLLTGAVAYLHRQGKALH